MDITKLELENDNLTVAIKGTKPDEVVGCQYVVYVKKRVFDPNLMGNLREYVLTLHTVALSVASRPHAWSLPPGRIRISRFGSSTRVSFSRADDDNARSSPGLRMQSPITGTTYLRPIVISKR